MRLIEKAAKMLGFEKRTYDTYWSDYASIRTGSVNEKTAQGVSAVYACVSAIAETIASLPLILYHNDDGLKRASDHSLYYVLHDQANPQMLALEFREYMQACVLLRGNAYACIVRGGDGQVKELWPLDPDTVMVARSGDKLVYEYADSDGVVHRLLSHEMLHLRNRLGNNLALGISPIAAARGVIQLALSEQEHGEHTFQNGTKLVGVLKYPNKLKPEQRDDIRQAWASQHAGAANAGKTPILEMGVDYQTVSMTLEDAEWIEARKFSVIEVCRLFRVPPVIVQSMESANYSNSVELSRQFVTLSLRRHFTMWEQAIHSKLLTEAGRKQYFAEHSVEGLLRGDSTNRAQFYKSGIDAGWMLKSEARKLENLPTIEGIDDLVQSDEGVPVEN